MKLRRSLSSVALLVALSALSLFAEDQKNLSAKPENNPQTNQFNDYVGAESIKSAYLFTERILQFFYKADGNLPKINSSKEKIIEYVMKKVFEYEDQGMSDAEKSKLFNDELANDADYHILELKKKLQQAITALETFQRDHTAECDFRRISDYKKSLRPDSKKVDDYEYRGYPYSLILELLEIDAKVSDAIEAQNETIRNLHRINETGKLKKTGMIDEDYFYRSFLSKRHFRSLAQDYLRSIPDYLGN
jgi:hypothetical protein